MATAKKKNAVAQTKKHEVAVPSYGEFEGTGYEGTSQDDYAIPYLNVLQGLSPEVGAEGEDSKVEGAAAGMMINSVTKQLIQRDPGLVFVPVTTEHAYVEWRPRESGGGIVGRHLRDSEVVRAAKTEYDFGAYKTEGGNDLIETFYMFGYELDDVDAAEPGGALVISFWSTKIKVYKGIMQTLRTFKGKPPLFANRLRITTVAQKNAQGNFFNFKINPVNGGVGESLIPPTLNDATHPLILHGKVLFDQIRSGERHQADDSLDGAAETDSIPF